jgi:hypothetical protein
MNLGAHLDMVMEKWNRKIVIYYVTPRRYQTCTIQAKIEQQQLLNLPGE